MLTKRKRKKKRRGKVEMVSTLKRKKIYDYVYNSHSGSYYWLFNRIQ